jgi:hypothetical protein
MDNFLYEIFHDSEESNEEWLRILAGRHCLFPTILGIDYGIRTSRISRPIVITI